MSTATESQPMQALAEANRVRMYRAEVKRAIASGEINIGDVLEKPGDCAGMTIGQLLASQRHWGKNRSQRFMRLHGVSDGKTVGSLTPRQVKVLRRALSKETLPRLTRAEQMESRVDRLTDADVRYKFNAMTRKRRSIIVAAQKKHGMSLQQLGRQFPWLFEVPGE